MAIESPNKTPNKSQRRYERPKDVCERLGISRTTLWRLERLGVMPTHYKIGLNSIVYATDEIDAFMESRNAGSL